MRLKTQKLPTNVNVALIEEGETTLKTTELDVESDMSPNNYTQFYEPKPVSIKENHAQSTNFLSPRSKIRSKVSINENVMDNLSERNEFKINKSLKISSPD